MPEPPLRSREPGEEDEEEDEDEEAEDEDEFVEQEAEEEEEEYGQNGNEGRMKQRLLDTEDDEGAPAQPQAQNLSDALNPQQQMSPSSKMMPQFPLVANAKPLMPGDYQAKWKSSQAIKNYSFATRTKINPNDVEQLVRAHKVMCIAASKNNDPAMFYMYAQREKTEDYFMVECKVFGNGRVDCVVKNDKNNGAELDGFYDYFKSIFARFM